MFALRVCVGPCVCHMGYLEVYVSVCTCVYLGGVCICVCVTWDAWGCRCLCVSSVCLWGSVYRLRVPVCVWGGCMYLCTCVYLYVCLGVCVSVYVCICVSLRGGVGICVYSVCTCVSVSVSGECMYLCVCATWGVWGCRCLCGSPCVPCGMSGVGVYL